MNITDTSRHSPLRASHNGMKHAIFLDRDGTINVEKNYLHRTKDWEWIPGATKAIRNFNEAGYLVVVVTNQAGVARSLYSEEEVRRLHEFIDSELAKEDALINAYYICPHHPDFGEQTNCDCRKPRPGMLLSAARDLCIDLVSSWLVGDKLSDIEAAEAAVVTPILVCTGYGQKDSLRLPANIRVEKDLYAASEHILLTLANSINKTEAKGMQK